MERAGQVGWAGRRRAAPRAGAGPRAAAFAVLLALLATLLPGGAPAARARDLAPPLPALGVAREGTTLSGLSSGAFFAVQLQVAFSSEFDGVAAVAGGPYLCAEGSWSIALRRCMAGPFYDLDAAYLWRRTLALARFGHIDPVERLRGIRAYVFHGKADQTVRRPVAEGLIAYWRAAGLAEPALRARLDVPAGHGFVVAGTPPGAVDCALTASPYINRCGDEDLAARILEHLLALPAPLPPPSGAAPPAGALLPFSQAGFLPNPRAHGLDETGFVYVPPGCAPGHAGEAACRLHIVFHGCRQGRSFLRPEDSFPRATGFLPHADALGLVLLFPQAAADPIRNPRGCWNFFGMGDPEHATRQGRQMRAVMAMVRRLREAPPPPPPPPQ